MGNNNVIDSLSLKELRAILSDRIKFLANPNISRSEKKMEHDNNLDIALLTKNYLNAYDMEIRLKRIKLDDRIIDAQIESSIDQKAIANDK